MSATGARILLTGCSGGGKSTLLGELAARGVATVVEPGRRVIAKERARGGTALPWVDLRSFAIAALTMARADLAAVAGRAEPVVFDRGLVDAAVALGEAGGGDPATLLAGLPRYDDRILFAPPWPELYTVEPDRPRPFADALTESDRLRRALPALGYTVIELPRVDVAARADFVLRELGS